MGGFDPPSFLLTCNGTLYEFTDTTGMEVSVDPALLPASFNLSPAVPNPFNPVTRLSLTLAESGPAQVKVYNIRGQLVLSILDEDLAPGRYDLHVNGSGLASGVYIVAATSHGQQQHQKILLLK